MRALLEQTDADEAFEKAAFVRRVVADVDPAAYEAYVGRYEEDDTPGLMAWLSWNWRLSTSRTLAGGMASRCRS